MGVAVGRNQPEVFVFMEYEIKSKPTIYNGTKFRSRLEARWACFFDLLGWKWQYEPFDLQGWTPDFIVYGSEGRFILVEIKPFIDDDVLAEYQAKVALWANGHNCIILSNDFNEDSGGILAGYQFDTFLEVTPFTGEPFKIHWKDGQVGNDSQFDIGSIYMAFDGVLWADPDNRKLFLAKDILNYPTFVHMWTKAGEKTRFHYE